MNQQALFHEDVYEALRVDVSAIGGAKRVGSMLWPEKTADKAGEHLNNCLNTARPEKLDPEQVILIKREAKKVGSFAAVFFECGEVGLSHPTPIEPEDEHAILQREFITATKHMDTIMKRFERLQGGDVQAIR